MESRLKLVREIYDNIPTLPPGGKWVPDQVEGDGVYFNENTKIKIKTAKTFEHRVLVPAQFPKEGEGGTSLPAQIEKWEEQKPVGEIKEQTWCGMISPAEKSRMLDRFDKLLRAVKKARQRANSVDVVPINIGKTIFDYINKN